MLRLIGVFAILALGGFVAAGVQDRPSRERARLVGLDPAAVEARIGVPTEKEELADSNEAYWVYRTKVGVLSVHFQNALVVAIDPADFPVESILK